MQGIGTERAWNGHEIVNSFQRPFNTRLPPVVFRQASAVEIEWGNLILTPTMHSLQCLQLYIFV